MDKAEDRGVCSRIPVRIMGAFHDPPQPYFYTKIALQHIKIYI